MQNPAIRLLVSNIYSPLFPRTYFMLLFRASHVTSQVYNVQRELEARRNFSRVQSTNVMIAQSITLTANRIGYRRCATFQIWIWICLRIVYCLNFSPSLVSMLRVLRYASSVFIGYRQKRRITGLATAVFSVRFLTKSNGMCSRTIVLNLDKKPSFSFQTQNILP
jgi:hypothetical protein